MQIEYVSLRLNMFHLCRKLKRDVLVVGYVGLEITQNGRNFRDIMLQF